MSGRGEISRSCVEKGTTSFRTWDTSMEVLVLAKQKGERTPYRMVYRIRVCVFSMRLFGTPCGRGC